jgi:hypothetical protein
MLRRSFLLLTLFMACAQPARADIFYHLFSLPVHWSLTKDYGDLFISSDPASTTDAIWGPSSGSPTTIFTPGPDYVVPDDQLGALYLSFPLDSVSTYPGQIVYHYSAGGSFTIENLVIDHGDGTSHEGSFSATLGKISIDTGEDGGYSEFGFSHGTWDPITAELLGLPGHEVYGEILWYIDFNERDFGQPTRFGRPYGYIGFDVPEPLLTVLVPTGLAAFFLRRKRARAKHC